MYPLYWTSSKEGIFMRYSHEFKKECLELYKQGKWMETPKGVKPHTFRDKIRYWSKLVDLYDAVYLLKWQVCYTEGNMVNRKRC